MKRPSVSAQDRVALPLAWPGRVPGDGFWIRHGFACENTWYNPGWWHCGEDWYALDDAETGSALVIAVSPGTVVFAGSEYPGRVVIIEQEDGSFAMYGHLSHEPSVSPGDRVNAGEQLGTVFHRTDGLAPSHLHFELRSFLFNNRVNGQNPEYGVRCGFECPPGPGYWPASAEHPARLGWSNPLVSRAEQLFIGSAIVASGAAGEIVLHSEPHADSPEVDRIEVADGDAFSITSVDVDEDWKTETSADAYRIWGRAQVNEETGWVRLVEPSREETGSDGRPSAVRLRLVPSP